MSEGVSEKCWCILKISARIRKSLADLFADRGSFSVISKSVSCSFFKKAMLNTISCAKGLPGHSGVPCPQIPYLICAFLLLLTGRLPRSSDSDD